MRRGLARAAFLAAALALAAAGCTLAERTVGPTYAWTSQTVPPTSLIEPMPQIYRPGEDILVTVQVIAPEGKKALDTYLPIRGRFYVRKQDHLLVVPPADENLARMELLPDEKMERSRSFTVNVARAFPMREPGWYLISWSGDSAHSRTTTVETAVRILPGAPKR